MTTIIIIIGTNNKISVETIFIIKYFWMCIISDTVLVDE